MMLSAQKSRPRGDLNDGPENDQAGSIGSSVQRWWPRKWAPTAVAVVGLIALGAGLGAISLAAIAWLVARQMPASSTVRRLALALLALFGMDAVVLTTAAVLGQSVDARVLAVAYLVIGGFCALRPHISSNTGLATSSDWWALGTALTTFAVYYRPFAGASPGRIMAQLSFSTDPGNHLGLVVQSLRQGGYVAGSDYPPAWAGNVGLAVRLIVGRAPAAADLLSISVPLIIGFYALLVFFGVALTVDAVQAAVGERSRWPAAVAVVCIGLATLVGYSHLLLSSGSYAQILAMTTLLAVSTVLASGGERTWRATVVLGLLSVVVMQTWYLLAPVLAVLLLAYLAAARPSRLLASAVAVPTAVYSAYPLLKSPAPVAQLNAVGGTPLDPSVLLVLMLLTLAGVVVLMRWKRPGTQPPVVLVLLVVAALFTTVLVLAVQLGTTRGFGYYGAKLFYVLFLFGALAAAAAAGVASDRGLRPEGSPRSRSRLLGAAVALLIVGGLAGVSTTTRDLSWRYAAGQAPGALDGAVLDAIFAAHPTGLPSDTDAWVLDGCFRNTDHIANKWTHDLFQTWTESRTRTTYTYRGGRAGDVSMLVDRAAESGVARMELYVHHDCNPDALARVASSPKVIVVRVP